MPAIPVHHTATDDGSWDGPAAKANLDNDGTQSYYESAYAWRDGGGDAETKADYKFIHHEVDSEGKVSAANIKACQSGIGVLNGGMAGTKIPDDDKKGVWEHLAAHLKDAGVDVPDLKSKGPSSQKHEPTSHKQLDFEIKSLSEDGTFEGKLAVYGNVDLGKDMIEPGAFKKTMAEKGNRVPMLWQHDSKTPIGDLELRDAADALYVKGRLLKDEIPEAKTAYALLKAGVIKGLSIGYDTVKDSVENGIRHLKELRLYEGSIVTFPMNEMATITSIKSAGGKQAKGDFNEEFAINQLLSANYQMIDALCSSLCQVTWSALDRDQKIDAAKAIVEQFTAAYMDYLPRFLDFLDGAEMQTMGKIEHQHKAMAVMMGRAITLISGETKEGRVISAASKKSLQAARDHGQKAMEHMKDADDIFDTLLTDEADDDDPDELDDDPDGDTPKAGAVSETKTEPVTSHSAAEASIADLMALIPKR